MKSGIKEYYSNCARLFTLKSSFNNFKSAFSIPSIQISFHYIYWLNKINMINNDDRFEHIIE